MSGYQNSDSSSTTALMPSSKRYTRSGIGGAGNYKSSSSTIPSTSSPLPIPVLRTTGIFLTGIGGSGNSRSYEERAKVSSAENDARPELRRNSGISWYHRGIGGAGNHVFVDGERQSSDDSRYSTSEESQSRSSEKRLSAWFRQ